jgi:hypothetical protein
MLSVYGFMVLCWALAAFQPVATPLPILTRTQAQNKRTQRSILRVGSEPMNPVFERVKTVHALDRAATVIGRKKHEPFLKMLLLFGIS